MAGVTFNPFQFWFHSQSTSLAKGQIEELERDIAVLATNPTKDLSAKEETLQDIQQKINALKDKNAGQRLSDQLEQVSAELYNQKKWVKFGFPESCLETHADCVKFMMESGFGSMIETFKTSSAKGQENHLIRLIKGEPHIRMMGEFRPWSEIQKLMEFDKEQNKVLSKEGPSIAYNYISPFGIAPLDRVPRQLYPIEKLDPEDHETLKNEAKQFWENHPEVDPGVKKECVLQIMSSSNSTVGDSELTRGLNEAYPNHTTIRVIDENGNVYSFGVEMTKDFEKFALADGYRNFLSTGYGQVATPDYQENRKADIRRITSIPMSTARSEQIQQLVRETNQGEGIRFCFSKQNCNKFAMVCAGIAGVEIDTRATFGEVFSRMLPKIEALPVIGGPLSILRDSINKVVQPIFTTLETYTPSPIKKGLSIITDVVFFIPRKIGTFIANSVTMHLGSHREYKKQPVDHVEDMPMDSKHLIQFSRLINSWKDLFVDEKTDSNHSFKLNDWMDKQATTRIYKREELPNMHIVR